MMDIFRNSRTPIDATLYCERYINDGSPSGFTFKNTTSVGTRFFDEVHHINLPVLSFKSKEKFSYFGNATDILNDNQLYVHPDLINDFCEDPDLCDIRYDDAIPLASSRTVFLPKHNKYIKLQYNGLIGRIERVISYLHVNHAMAVNNILTGTILPSKLHYFPEEHARIYKQRNGKTIGMVIRDINLIPSLNGLVIPAFSLYSKDKNSKTDASILIQLIEHAKKDVNEFVFEDIIKPVIDLYFFLLIKFGLQIEAHAQNICYALSYNGIHVALRDFESIDKDIEIAREYNQYFNVQYKCFGKNSPDYFKRHSFMFDFKLGEYLISPILQEASLAGCDVNRVIKMIKLLVHSYINCLPSDFFPSNYWYSFPNKLIDRETKTRPYIQHACPKYR